VTAGIARVGLPHRVVGIIVVLVMVPIGGRRLMVIVRGRAVVVVRVIVPAIFVDVHGRRHGRGNDHGLDQHEREEPAHRGSLLRPASARAFRHGRRPWWMHGNSVNNTVGQRPTL
jgi:hypothetical protein